MSELLDQMNKTRELIDKSEVELRGNVPRWIADVLDGVAIARETSRMAIVNEILAPYAKQRLHEAMLLQRIVQRNGSQPPTGRATRLWATRWPCRLCAG
ncbi:MAG: hypothetical protein M0Z99_32140 [Betaproteobacteria bacterium]|nr:hypothetical protein [Betaproteobacteria bacterium]